ncbi:MAG: undecaprenyl-phosphate glucose phosphotransferase [Vicinamibacteria bacterium]|nr:undecaprenyl-phosphate glucose phosphotransferase [Vicinamibacteria bacterium]
MVKDQARLLTAAYVTVDVVATAAAWLLAFLVRFHSPLVTEWLPITKGLPQLETYLVLLPVIAILWPLVLYVHGLYRLRRDRPRLDEFFTIVWSVAVATAFLLAFTLYLRVYWFYEPEVAPRWEFSQGVFGVFVVLDVAALYAGRALFRAWLQRRWATDENARRLLVAGAGDLGRAVAATLTGHRELGYRVVGFLDDHATGAVDGLPVLGRLEDATRVLAAERIDQLYVALPLEEHSRLVSLIRCVANECVDIRVVPDLVQYATLKAGLEDLDGIPIIALNEVPLRGLASLGKRLMDLVVGTAMIVVLSPLLALIAVLIKWKGGRGPILLSQERMTLDGKTFQIYKFRTMVEGAEKDTGPVFATEDDPRRTAIGVLLRKYNLDELPQLANIVMGEMSLVGPRPERPPFVQQFRERIPQYMLRHRVKSGLTGWAQVNGWRGNSSIEKRIEYDLYYIENWSLLLDVKILLLTLLRGFGQKHAY